MNQFNDSILFNPGDLRMAYTIRDPIINSKNWFKFINVDSQNLSNLFNFLKEFFKMKPIEALEKSIAEKSLIN